MFALLKNRVPKAHGSGDAGFGAAGDLLDKIMSARLDMWVQSLNFGHALIGICVSARQLWMPACLRLAGCASEDERWFASAVRLERLCGYFFLLRFSVVPMPSNASFLVSSWPGLRELPSSVWMPRSSLWAIRSPRSWST